jgi:hypothetical protein
MSSRPHIIPLTEAGQLEEFVRSKEIQVAASSRGGSKSNTRKRLMFRVRFSTYLVFVEADDGSRTEEKEFMEIRDAINAYNDLG